MRGMTLARSVVLPEPLQPARPMMRMRHYSSPSAPKALPFRHSPRDESESARRSAPAASNFALRSLLFRRLHFSSRWLRADISRAEFPLGPQVVVLLCPVDVHRAIPHRLECAFHSNGADIDVAEHGGDEQQRHDAVDD